MRKRAFWIAAAGTLAVTTNVRSQPAPRDPPLFSKWQGRAAVAGTRTVVSLTPDGPWLDKPAPAGTRLDVHDEHGDRFQIVDERHGLALVLYVAPATLQPVAQADVDLVPSLAAAAHARSADSPGVRLEEGTPIELVAAAGEQLTKVRVTWSRRAQVTGYVPTDGIGFVFREFHRIGAMGITDVKLPPRFTLLDAPRGSPFAVSTDRDRGAAKLIRREGKMALVRVGDSLVGWIAARQLQSTEADMSDLSGGGFVAVGDFCANLDPFSAADASRCADPKNTLPVGTRLFDAVDGHAVGVVLRDFRAPLATSDRGWSSLDIESRYGKLKLFAPPGAVAASGLSAPPRDPQSEFAARLKRGPDRIAPSDSAKAQIVASKRRQVFGDYQVCFRTSDGEVTRVIAKRATGVPDYEAAIIHELHAVQFSPSSQSGEPPEMCGRMVVIYPPGAVRPTVK